MKYQYHLVTLKGKIVLSDDAHSMVQWLSTNWFSVIQTLGIMSSLLFTAHTLRSNNKSQRIANLFQITQYHRDMWANTFEHPELQVIFDPAVDLSRRQVTREERIFVTMMILHLNATFEAIEANAIAPIDGLRKDIVDFFSLPIPRVIWNDIRKYQNKRFVKFVQTSSAIVSAQISSKQME
ncbi:MAG TPA: hypothetical protein VGK27_05585 [Candidatus Deferrimicrobiaceae bacterium]|jgi:hypothetical protein